MRQLIPPYGERLRNYRNQKGLTQLDLEHISMLSNGTVSRIETGITNPTKETLIKLGQALNLSRAELLRLLCLDIY